MSDFSVVIPDLKNEINTWKLIISSLNINKELLNTASQSFSLSGSAGDSVKKSLKLSSEELEDLIKNAKEIKLVLSHIITDYEKAEKRIKGIRISNGVGGADSNRYYAVADISSTYTQNGITHHMEGSVLTAEGEAGVDTFGAHAKGSAAVAKGEDSYLGEYGGVSVEGSILEVNGEVSAGIPKGFSIDENEASIAGVSASAAVAVASGKLEGHLGTDTTNVHGKAEGSVLGADAKAELGVVAGDGNIGIRASAGAEAYYAKGEVSAGFTIFGIDIDVGAEGLVGVEAKASAEVGIAGFGFDLGLGPVGLDVAIDWSDFEFKF